MQMEEDSHAENYEHRVNQAKHSRFKQQESIVVRMSQDYVHVGWVLAVFCATFVSIGSYLFYMSE